MLLRLQEIGGILSKTVGAVDAARLSPTPSSGTSERELGRCRASGLEVGTERPLGPGMTARPKKKGDRLTFGKRGLRAGGGGPLHSFSGGRPLWTDQGRTRKQSRYSL